VTSLPKASIRDTAGFVLEVFIPTAAKGPLMRRPKVKLLPSAWTWTSGRSGGCRSWTGSIRKARSSFGCRYGTRP
jgi:hypothetical protein